MSDEIKPQATVIYRFVCGDCLTEHYSQWVYNPSEDMPTMPMVVPEGWTLATVGGEPGTPVAMCPCGNDNGAGMN